MDHKIKITYVFVLVLLLSAFVLALVPLVQAQGTYVCKYSISDGCRVSEEQSNCAEGYFGTCEGGDVLECLANSGNECVGGPPLAEKVLNLYNLALGVGVILALGILVYAGVRYTASAGNASAIGDAKKWIWAALIGLVLLFGAYVFLNVLNPNLLNLEDPTTPQNEPQPPPDVNLTLPGADGTAPPEGSSCFDNSDCPSGYTCKFSDLNDASSGTCKP